MLKVTCGLFKIVSHSHWVALPAKERRFCCEEKLDSGETKDFNVSRCSRGLIGDSAVKN